MAFHEDKCGGSRMEESMSAPQGWIYVMTSAGLEQGIYKIGATIHDPLERARQLSAVSSSPSPFFVAYKKHLASPFQVEAALHRIFDSCRVNDSREFFRIDLHRIIEVLETYDEVRELLYEGEVHTPFARLFAEFPDDGSPRELNTDEQFRCRQLEYKLGIGRQ